jgi:hypothetical protein
VGKGRERERETGKRRDADGLETESEEGGLSKVGDRGKGRERGRDGGGMESKERREWEGGQGDGGWRGEGGSESDYRFRCGGTGKPVWHFMQYWILLVVTKLMSCT